MRREEISDLALRHPRIALNNLLSEGQQIADIEVMRAARKRKKTKDSKYEMSRTKKGKGNRRMPLHQRQMKRKSWFSVLDRLVRRRKRKIKTSLLLMKLTVSGCSAKFQSSIRIQSLRRTRLQLYCQFLVLSHQPATARISLWSCSIMSTSS